MPTTSKEEYEKRLDTKITEIGLSERNLKPLRNFLGECTLRMLIERCENGCLSWSNIGGKVIDELSEKLKAYDLTVVKLQLGGRGFGFRVAHYEVERKTGNEKRFTEVVILIGLDEIKALSRSLQKYHSLDYEDCPLMLCTFEEVSPSTLARFRICLKADYSRIDKPTRRLLDTIYPPTMSTKLADLPLSYRARKGFGNAIVGNSHCCRPGSYKWKYWDEGLQITIGELHAYFSNVNEFLNVRNMGIKSVEEMVRCCTALGIKLWDWELDENE